MAAGEYEDGSSVVAQVDMLQGLFGSVGAVFELCVGEAFAETRVGGLVGVKGRGAERGGDVSAFTLDREGEGRVGLYFDGNTGGVF